MYKWDAEKYTGFDES